MRVHQEEFEHPSQASRVRLNVFEEAAGGSPVAGLRDDAGFLVTEDRIGSATVVATLGFFRTREEALAQLQARAAQLLAQKYRPAAAA